MAEETMDETAAAPPADRRDDASRDDAHGGHGDEIHMPRNSYWPLVTAIGVAVTLVGLIPILENPIGFIVGVVILLVGIGGWVRDARKEYKELH
jgi:Cytochrome c oxidase subunit IV